MGYKHVMFCNSKFPTMTSVLWNFLCCDLNLAITLMEVHALLELQLVNHKNSLPLFWNNCISHFLEVCSYGRLLVTAMLVFFTLFRDIWTDIEQILKEAQHRWLRPAEICEILKNYRNFRIALEPPNRPPSMTFIFYAEHWCSLWVF